MCSQYIKKIYVLTYTIFRTNIIERLNQNQNLRFGFKLILVITWTNDFINKIFEVEWMISSIELLEPGHPKSEPNYTYINRNEYRTVFRYYININITIK